MAELTGKIRYRPSVEKRFIEKKNVLVLQVEVTGFRDYIVGGHIEVEHETWWRDARVEDLLELNNDRG